ncbi:SphA family protein [Ferrimonas kyonanensis]|uniref:SphA family protein n=1 Tax=Ferrimonas kyonanensis TaxID=364763 RepID=UPI001FDF5C4C|nr:transporter [Ferrimonas kyonanensis]
MHTSTTSMTTWLTLAALVSSASVAAATSGSHYPMGAEGVKAATAPPPGLHYRLYNTLYSADTQTNNAGQDSGLDFNLDLFAQVHRFVQVTDTKLFGANWGYNVLIPLIDKELSIEPLGVNDSHSLAMGDIVIEPLSLFWFKERFDAAFALAVIAPSGDFDARQAVNPGFGYWSGMLSAGATYYLDEQKSWSFSALTRTLINGKQEDTDIRPGAEFIIEGGLGKEFSIDHTWLLQPGISYCASWQISDDSKDGHGTIANERKRAFGLGAEINAFYLPWLMQVNFRYVKELETKNTTEGSSAVLTFTKSF